MRLSEVQEELRARNLALKETQERYSLAARGANDGIWDWKVEEAEAYFSPRWKVILGYDSGEVGDAINEWLDRIHPEDREDAVGALRDHLAMRSSHYESEHRLRQRDGSWLWVRVRGQAVWDVVGRPTRMAGSMTDISRSKAAEERLVFEATHDVLTGLYNRRHVMALLSSEVHAARRYGYPVSVCLCDLDRFKHINDSYGHPVGDEVLASFGKLLKDELRAEDLAGRYGGDEFIMVFPHVAARDAGNAVERIRRLFREVHLSSPGGEQVQTTATFGITNLTDEYNQAEDLVAAADVALYEAKEEGRDCVYIEELGLVD
jgi:diguanylate cyclase (GGDEF)-like protein/PAS domain S-box-containing protein